VDEHTLEKLEYDRIRRLLATHAQCGLGKSLALRVRPSKHISQVRHWLDQLEQFERWVQRSGFPPFGGIRDVRDLIREAVPPNKLEPEEFGQLASTLMGVDAVRVHFADIPAEFDMLVKINVRIGDFRVVVDRINRIIDSRGKVRDDASGRLSRLRSEIAAVRRQGRELFDKLLKQPSIVKYLQYPNATFHADRMVLPLKADQRGRIPGIIHRSSDSGQTLFVEPAQAVELNNRRINLIESEREEIGRILWELTHLVHLNQAELLHTLEAVALVDLLTAKLKFAERYRMHRPAINDRHLVKLTRARNPILMAMLEGDGADESRATKQEPRAFPARRDADASRQASSNTDAGANADTNGQVVPIDVRLGDDFDVMIITGPNTGGKTAALKTVGLLALMAQSGLPIPAEAGSTLPVFQGIWIDVGDEQSLQQSLSTFSAHLSRILDIISRARKSTLVLLDETGAGTDPDEGAAIGQAIIEHLLDGGCLAMITTHLGALKALGYAKRRADNASVLFDVKTLKPTYRLRIGEPGNSNAINIASRLGMPKKMVHAARKHLAGRHRVLQKAIAGTLTARRQAERARRDADQARQQAAREALAAHDKTQALETEHSLFKAWADRIIRLQPGDRVRVRHFDDPGRVVRIHLEKQRVTVSVGSKELEVAMSDMLFD